MSYPAQPGYGQQQWGGQPAQQQGWGAPPPQAAPPPPPSGGEAFQRPATQVEGDKFEPKNYFNPQTGSGALLLIYATEFKAQVKTTNGLTDMVQADIVILDAPGPDGQPTVLHNSGLFSVALVNQTKNAVGGSPVLGRLSQGQAKPGQSAPWLLADPTDADCAQAQQYINTHPRSSFTQPPPQQQPPAAPPQQQAPGGYGPPPVQQGGWGAPPPQQQPPAAGVNPALAQQLAGLGLNPAQFVNDDMARQAIAGMGQQPQG